MNHRNYVLGMTPMACAHEHHRHAVNPHIPLYVLIESRTVLPTVVWLQKMPPRSHISPRESSLLVSRYHNCETAVIMLKALVSLIRQLFLAVHTFHIVVTNEIILQQPLSYLPPLDCHWFKEIFNMHTNFSVCTYTSKRTNPTLEG
jgi:hypothetical protein